MTALNDAGRDGTPVCAGAGHEGRARGRSA